tara:strand:+ start:59 stop:268 length:210 start_codon:yes stop_codon:yes gene_type:complete
MIELLIGVLGCVFLYWLGGIWMPEHKTTEQEVIKIEVKKDSLGYEMWCSPEGYEAIEEYVKLAEGEEKE